MLEAKHMDTTLRVYDRQQLIEMGLIVESEEVFDGEDGEMPDDQSEEFVAADQQQLSDFPDADYSLQNEIIRFFSNNPGADPELFRQYAAAVGVEPDALQKQMNILFSQLLKVYLKDAEDLGYGDALVGDGEISDEIQQLIGPPPAEGDED